ncbi:2TM domain-containing protein [Flagellimonas sp.]|uniref:2TM domain-containing protein n=1 Tax=Flagellimonas sp. TaxID=2058762 RepID=UPI003BB18A31
MEPEVAKYGKAQKKARKIRGFYTHVFVFLLFNAILWIVKADTSRMIIEATGIQEVGFANYLHWQFWTITLSWAAIILIQGLTLFGRPLIAKWERRKMQEFMNKENNGIHEH